MAVALLGGSLLSGCTKPPSASNPSPPVAQSEATVVFSPPTGAPPWIVKVEVARSSEELMRGLMFRRELAPDGGMLFMFAGEDIRRFWMRNTYIPLDMVFLDSRRVVVGIEENAVPLDETSRGPDAPAQYVVEVRGGDGILRLSLSGQGQADATAAGAAATVEALVSREVEPPGIWLAEQVLAPGPFVSRLAAAGLTPSIHPG